MNLSSVYDNAAENKVKKEQTWAVYYFDEFGAERKAGTVPAKSKGHAMSIIRKQGVSNVHDAVLKESK
jgi:hypothetical protein